MAHSFVHNSKNCQNRFCRKHIYLWSDLKYCFGNFHSLCCELREKKKNIKHFSHCDRRKKACECEKTDVENEIAYMDVLPIHIKHKTFLYKNISPAGCADKLFFSFVRWLVNFLTLSRTMWFDSFFLVSSFFLTF